MTLHNPRRRFIPYAVALTLFTLAAVLESRGQSTAVAYGYEAQGATNGQEQALYEAAGEFRIVIANLLWSKVVDQYHHQFMAHGGEWDKNVSLLPILHTIVQLDPHFVEAYELMGGEILPKTGHVMLAEKVLLEGVKNNPNSWELDRETAMHFALVRHDNVRASFFAKLAMSNANDMFSRNLSRRLFATMVRREKSDQQRVNASRIRTASRTKMGLRR